MRRDVLVALLVIIPVIILIAISLSPAGGEERGEGKILPAPDAAPDAATARRPSPQPSPPAGERETVGALVQPLVLNAKQCLTDQKQQQQVEVHFTPTREGRYVDVRVVTQDPFLEACLQDVFEEARWTVSPGATESFAPTSITFTAE